LNYQLSNEILHFTHSDLDALGCMLHLEYALPTTPKQVFHTSYLDIEEKTTEVIDYAQKHFPKMLLISDISFTQSKHLLLRLQELSKLGITIILLDHHAYPDDFFDGITIKYVHDISKSATKICQEFFKTEGKNESLDKLSDIINAFDIWLDKTPLFHTGMILNDWFWQKIKFGNNITSIEGLMNQIVANNYKILPDFKPFAIEHVASAKTFIDKAKEKNLIASDGFMTVAFCDEYFNDILYEEFSRGIDFVVIANSYGITRFRFNTKANLSTEQKLEIKGQLIKDVNIGHLNAFSDKIQNSNFDKIMTRIQEVSKIIEPFKLLNQIK
jgi:oligoribonuclease NrnB/cAMP/cGMP phosphodiesterase (DHH superfamily)